ncbi:helix-turn-helix domain-containing protein [Halopelagius inordinatus]|nr:helix-turn-helix domain-containing protein [Halopelagius inordinatus]
MSIVAEFSVPADQFLFGETIAAAPGLSIDVERAVPAGSRIMPYVWARGDGRAEFVTSMRENDYVRSVVVRDKFEDSSLCEVEWEESAERLVHEIHEMGATILEACVDGVRWRFRIRFESHDGLAKFNVYCKRHEIPYRLDRIAHLSTPSHPTDAYGLTAPQREALSLAVERGYFEVPRQVGFDELADELGVSVQAFSERVRRGADKVLRSALSARTDDND